MLITLHCGGMPFDGTTIDNKSLGGSESAAYYMARELAKLGHKVTMFTNTEEETITDDVRYAPCGQISEQFPLGEIFHYVAANTPTDVMIIQRHPKAFMYQWASKINFWWIHDLALMRSKGMVSDMMVNVDGILTVSEWHKAQVVEVYGVNPDYVYPITNGVDLELFKSDKMQRHERTEACGQLHTQATKLLYTSRPERGLENLVKPDGIMEKLNDSSKNFHLYVCAYDNTTDQQRNYYEYLNARCESLPNVTVLGSLTKQELADVMCECDLHIYPSTFEETSCITAMECMAAGLPMIASKVGALPETVNGAGVLLNRLDEGGVVSVDDFCDSILKLGFDDEYYNKLQGNQFLTCKKYDWENTCQRLTSVFGKCFEKAQTSPEAIAKSFLQVSDYYMAKTVSGSGQLINSDIGVRLERELEECYAFTKAKVWDEHYKNYYQYEKDRGVNYGPEDLSNNHRFMHVSSLIADLPTNSIVLDYGCAHGHYTVNLAKAYPELRFIGIDITESNVEKARAWAEKENIPNCKFRTGRVANGALVSENGNHPITVLEADCIIAAEVLEHVADPQEHTDTLSKFLKVGGLMIVTTPYGPWEAQGFKEHWPWRAHVHHFEREDLADIWGHNLSFKVVNIPAGSGVGSYVTTWKAQHGEAYKAGQIDYDRKLALAAPTQTISCCMIVKDAETTMLQCLESVMPHVDELVIGWDSTGDEYTRLLVMDYMSTKWPEKSYNSFVNESPIEIGFCTARNMTLQEASGDWILWIDSDEVLQGGENLSKYLRSNQFNGYAIKQHHVSAQPAGILKTDIPVRIFRSNKDIKFFGLVHEHPEQELNEGVGFVDMVDDVFIMHSGYTDERVRRQRFSRNIELLVKDRKENPERILGKYLWIRDLAQTCQWELEETRGKVTNEMVAKAEEGINLWRSLLIGDDVRITVDALEFYSVLSRIRGQGFEMEVKLDTNLFGNADANKVKPIKAYFDCVNDAGYLMNTVFTERTKTYEGKYK